MTSDASRANETPPADQPSPAEVGELDLDAIAREIEADARERRRSGVYPPEYERELAELFARFAPPAASGDLRALVDVAEEHGLIEPFIPTESHKPAGRYVKQGFAKALGWYHTWLTQEISQFAGAAVRALRVAADRLDGIEATLGHQNVYRTLFDGLPMIELDEVTLDEIASVATRPAADVHDDAVRGPVLVARAGTGELVARLEGAGVRAYGVEPDAANREIAEEHGVDLLGDTVSAHLRSVRLRSLGGAVLVGHDVDLALLGARLVLIDEAIARLADSSTLVVVAAREATLAQSSAIAAFAGGPTWSGAAWSYVFASRRLVDVETFDLATHVVVAGRVDRPTGR